MWKRLVAGAMFCLSWGTWFSKETIKAWIFDHVIHLEPPHVPSMSEANIVEYGPPAIFAAICLSLIAWDIWDRRRRVVVTPTLQERAEANRQLLHQPAVDLPLNNVSSWTTQDVLAVWQAANLWVELEPKPQISQTSLAYPALTTIKGALADGSMRSLDGGTNMSARVRRKDLISLAIRKNQFPKFLFPD